MTELWYTTASPDTPLTQGDLITVCPVLRWVDVPTPGPELGAATLQQWIEGVAEDVIVMTQACDLENYKVTNVILCPAISLPSYKMEWQEARLAAGESIAQKYWESTCKSITNDYTWNLAMLNRGQCGTLTTEHRVVDFHDIYTVPRGFLESWVRHVGRPRLQLLPPYREHLSQAFARYFMRVGLPEPVSKGW